MMAFLVGVLLAVGIAIVAWFGLGSFERNAADAFSTSSTRVEREAYPRRDGTLAIHEGQDHSAAGQHAR